MGSINVFHSIKILIDDLDPIHSVKIKFHNEVLDKKCMDEKMQLNVFRNMQEQINNILKHAGAKLVTIDLSRNENVII